MTGANHPRTQPEGPALRAHVRRPPGGRLAGAANCDTRSHQHSDGCSKKRREQSSDPAAKFHALALVLGNFVLAIPSWARAAHGDETLVRL